MSNKLINLVWECCNKQISSAQRLILLRLAALITDCGNKYPNLSTIMRGTGLGRSTVFREIKELEKKSIIGIVKYDSNSQPFYGINISELKKFLYSDHVLEVENDCISDQKSYPQTYPHESQCETESHIGTELSQRLVPTRDSQSQRGTLSPNAGLDGKNNPQKNEVIHTLSTDLSTGVSSRSHGFEQYSNQELSISNIYIKNNNNNFFNTNALGNTNQENLEREITSDGDIENLEHAFEAFWSEYPRQVGKSKSKIAFLQACVQKKLNPQVIISAAKSQRKERELRQQLGLMVPELMKGPTAWLEEERWEDGVMTEAQVRKEAEAKWNSKKTIRHLSADRNRQISDALDADLRARLEKNRQGDGKGALNPANRHIERFCGFKDELLLEAPPTPQYQSFEEEFQAIFSRMGGKKDEGAPKPSTSLKNDQNRTFGGFNEH